MRKRSVDSKRFSKGSSANEEEGNNDIPLQESQSQLLSIVTSDSDSENTVKIEPPPSLHKIDVIDGIKAKEAVTKRTRNADANEEKRRSVHFEDQNTEYKPSEVPVLSPVLPTLRLEQATYRREDVKIDRPTVSKIFENIPSSGSTEVQKPFRNPVAYIDNIQTRTSFAISQSGDVEDGISFDSRKIEGVDISQLNKLPTNVPTKRSEKNVVLNDDSNLRYITYCALVESLYRYGSPTLNLMGYAESLTAVLSLPEVSIRISPTGFWVHRGRKVEFISCGRSANINKLVLTVELLRNVTKGHMECEVVCEALEEIQEKKPLYNSLFKIISYPIYAMGFTVFFYGGDWKGVPVSCGLGLLSGLVDWAVKLGFGKDWVYLKTFGMCMVAGLVSGILSFYNQMEHDCAYAAALGATAIYFPGVTVSFSILEMMMEYLTVGAVRFVYSQFLASMIATGLLAGFYTWFAFGNVPYPEQYEKCSRLLDLNIGFYFLFYACLFAAACIFYEIPLTIAPCFLIVQASTYLTYYLLSSFTNCGSYCATGVACLVMVLLSAFLSHRTVRKLSPKMTPMATIIPALELLVPGSLMVNTFVSMSQGGSAASGNVALTFTAVSIAIGFLFADALLKSVIPGMTSVLTAPEYKGSLNNLDPAEINDPKYVFKSNILPNGCVTYLMVVAHEASNLVAADLLSSDPYFQIKNKKGEILARSSTIPSTLFPEWEEAFVVPIVLSTQRKMALRLEVRDCDRFMSDDDIGDLTCEIKIDEEDGMEKLLINGEAIIPLRPENDNLFFTRKYKLQNVKSGEINLSLGFHSDIDIRNLEGKATNNSGNTTVAQTSASARLQVQMTQSHANTGSSKKKAENTNSFLSPTYC